MIVGDILAGVWLVISLLFTFFSLAFSFDAPDSNPVTWLISALSFTLPSVAWYGYRIYKSWNAPPRPTNWSHLAIVAGAMVVTFFAIPAALYLNDMRLAGKYPEPQAGFYETYSGDDQVNNHVWVAPIARELLEYLWIKDAVSFDEARGALEIRTDKEALRRGPFNQDASWSIVVTGETTWQSLMFGISSPDGSIENIVFESDGQGNPVVTKTVVKHGVGGQ